MKYEHFLLLIQNNPEEAYKLFVSMSETINLLMKQIDSYKIQVEKLEARVKELEAQINKNSRNSSKPPSTDEFIKPKSSRKKSGKSSGGQKGHKGNTLKMSNNPDFIVTHSPKTCLCCGHSLEEEKPQSIEKRQVFDLPPLKIYVTEHQTEKKLCPCCGLKTTTDFPEGVELPVQYGT